ncbi:MAG: hypothetical protein BGN88_12005 [Clostridiales bacterium 43-6]|nr:MAG: hypothetical protein BGN88_12005 [Clostridiales bacterium 43-6]
MYKLSCFADEISPFLSEQIEVLKKTEIRYIEARGIDNKNIADLTIAEAKEAKKKLDADGFQVSALGAPTGKIGILDNFEPHLDQFKHLLELMTVFETEYIRVFSFYIPKDANFDQYTDPVLERMQKFLDAAKGMNIKVLHENEHGIFGNIPERCKLLSKELNNPMFKLIYDSSNYILEGVEAYPHAFETVCDETIYYHIKDAVYSENRVVPAGMGDGQLPSMLGRLVKYGYDGFFSIEPHLGYFEGLAAFEHNLDIASMPKGGPQLFMIAYEALKNILNNIK